MGQKHEGIDVAQLERAFCGGRSDERGVAGSSPVAVPLFETRNVSDAQWLRLFKLHTGIETFFESATLETTLRLRRRSQTVRHTFHTRKILGSTPSVGNQRSGRERRSQTQGRLESP